MNNPMTDERAVAWLYEAEFSSGSYSPNYYQWEITRTFSRTKGARKIVPLYTAPPPPALPEGVSEEDVEAAAAASGLPVRFPNDRKRVVDALESYRARLMAKAVPNG